MISSPFGPLIDRPRFAAAVVVLVAILACIAGIGNEFVQDDVPILAEDFRLHDVTQWPRLFVEPYWPPPRDPDLYRPLTSLVLSLQFIAGGGSPVAVRVVSYLLYALACVAVWRLVRRLIRDDRAAFAAALVFAAHPVHVEATALGVGQAELLVTLFTVLGVERYLRMRALGQSGLRSWTVLAALYVAAALSKEQGLVFPLFLLACELVGAPAATGDMKAKGPSALKSRNMLGGYGMLLLIGAALFGLRSAILGSPASSRMVAEQLMGQDFAGRLPTVLQAIPEYVRLLFWPAHLRLDYSPQEFVASGTIGTAETLGIAVVLAVGAAGWFARHRMPGLTFGILWTALAIGPVSNLFLPTGILIAERTMFLPSVGVVIGLASVFATLSRRHYPVYVARAAGAALVVLVAAGIVRSALRHGTWRSNDSLTLAAVEDSPRSWRATLNHANLLFERGERVAAIAAYERAIAFATSPWQVRHEFAKRLRLLGDEDRALEQLGLSLVEQPANNEAMRDIIAVLLALGRYPEARSIVHQVIARGETSNELLQLGRLADSAIAVEAPPGTIRVGVPALP